MYSIPCQTGRLFGIVLIVICQATCGSVVWGQAADDVKTESTVTRPADVEFQKFGGIEYRSGVDSEGEPFQLTLDVYVPEGQGPFPSLLLIHGGAWRAGTKLNWFRHARVAARGGFTVVVINYRKAPRFQHPSQLQDCKAAVHWMRQHAETYKIAPDQIGALGYSAGAHLAAMLGVTDQDDGFDLEDPEFSLQVQAVAVGGAPCEFSWIEPDSGVLFHWLGDTRAGDPEVYQRAAPLSYVTADDPPFYFYHGGRDWVVPKESAEKMHQALLKAGVPSQFQSYDNQGHFGLFSNLDAMDPVLDFFRANLGKERE